MKDDFCKGGFSMPLFTTILFPLMYIKLPLYPYKQPVLIKPNITVTNSHFPVLVFPVGMDGESSAHAKCYLGSKYGGETAHTLIFFAVLRSILLNIKESTEAHFRQ
jgi:hypothetical protein